MKHHTPSLRANSLLAFITLTLLSLTTVFAGSPSVTYVAPQGGQRGKTHPVTLHGAALADIEEIVFYQPGIKVDSFEPRENGKLAKMKFHVDAKTEPGAREFRVRTKTGLSGIRFFYVGTLPDITEKSPNEDLAEAQELPLNSTVNGIAAAEDVDYYKFKAKKGQRISVEVEGIRFGTRLLDPRVAILDERRFELAACDDCPLLQQDSFVSIIIPADGTYYISMRDASYVGNSQTRYRLHLGTFPRPTAVFPLGGPAGEKLKIKFLGLPDGEFEQDVKLGPASRLPQHIFAQQNGQFAPSPNYLRVCDFRNVIEEKDISGRTDLTTCGDAPFAINGILRQPGQQDYFEFTAKKGQKLNLRVHARNRLRTPADTQLYIYNGTSPYKYLKSNDDAGGPDSYFVFDVPADGPYQLLVRDHLRNGGPDFVYRIEVTPVKPQLSVNLPIFLRRTQYNQHMVVPQGNRNGFLLTAKRENFSGDLKILANNLPPGVKMHAPLMPSKVSQIPIIFEADADAPRAFRFADLGATHVDPKKNIAGGYFQQHEILYGRNNDTYTKSWTEKLPVAVADPAPFKLTLVQPKVPIVHGGILYLNVKAERTKDFDGPIKVRMLFKPPGLGASTELTLAKGKTEIDYRINANGAIGEQTWPLAILGWADRGGKTPGKVWAASNLIDLQATTPFVTGGIVRGTAQQGKETDVVCTLNQLKPFEGEATISLTGLPSGVKSTPQTFTKDTKEIVFPCTIDPKARKGQHKSLFCSLTIKQNGEDITASTAGGGHLRIDVPPPPKKDAPKVAAKPKAPAPKRLTRLEQLRQDKAAETGAP